MDRKQEIASAVSEIRKSCLYRVSEDPDHRYALYVNSSLGGHGTPAHNHTTWAVIVGITGEELNRFYDRSPEGPPRVNFHMYGLALDQLHSREYYQAAESTWKVFPAHGDIREAR